MSTIQSAIQNVSLTTVSAMNVSSSTTIASLGINATTVNSTLPSSNLTWSPTMQPYWNISGSTGSYWNISDTTGSYWNITGYGNYSSNWTSYPGEWQPYYPPCTSCYPSVVVTPSYSYSYFSYAYVYVLFLLLLLAVSLILVKVSDWEFPNKLISKLRFVSRPETQFLWEKYICEVMGLSSQPISENFLGFLAQFGFCENLNWKFLKWKEMKNEKLF